MKKTYSNTESKGLPGGPNEVFTYTTGVFSTDTFSTEGYKRNSPDVNNPYNIIPSGNITMEDVDFPVHGVDNLGNEQMMTPGNDYQFPGDMVFETPMYKRGGGLLTKTMKCNNCSWEWKAADGGNDVSTCHKCGSQALPKAQDGGGESGNPPDYSKMYTYKGRPSAKYIKDGDNWSINLGSDTQNKFVPIKDSTGERARILESQAIPIKETQDKKFQEALNYHKDWMSSPRYNEMLSASIHKTYPGRAQSMFMRNSYADVRKENLESIPNLNTWYAQPEGNPKTGGWSYPDSGLVEVFPNGYNVNGLMRHEVSHSVDTVKSDEDQYALGQGHRIKGEPMTARAIPFSDKKLIFRAKDKKSPALPNNYGAKFTDYVSTPTETRARLNDIRGAAKERGIFDPFTQKVTPEIYKKLKKEKFEVEADEGFDALHQLRSVFSDDDILEMLNTISDAGDSQGEHQGMLTAEDGGGIPKAQDGTETKPWIQDYNFTQADLDFLNSDEDYCPQGGCLEQAFKAQDIMFGGKRGFPTSTETKNDLGIQSADKRKLGYPYYNADGVLMRANPDERMRKEIPVSDKNKNWLESVPYFDIGNYDGGDYTADSWDIHGILVEAGGKNLFTRGLYNPSDGRDDNHDLVYTTQSISDLSEDKLKKLYSEITIGTIIGFNAYPNKNVKYNEKYGLTPSGHSTMVVGFDERGVPVVYDYGNYTPIDAGSKGYMANGTQSQGTLSKFSNITNITYPPNSKGKTYSWLKEQGMFDTTPEELNLNYDALETELYAKGDKKALTSFHNSLVDNKRKLMNSMNISNKDYDMMSGLLLAQTMQESAGGESFENNWVPNWASQALGDTQGLTQLNITNILDDEQLAPIAKKFGITEESDLFDPEKSAIASMIYAKRNLQAGKKNYEKGKGQKGTRTFYPRNDIRETAGMNVNITFNGYEFKTEEGKIVDFFTGNNWSGVGWDKSIKDIQAEFEKIAPGKYTVREEDGVRVVDKITNGNKGTNKGESDLSDEEIFAYNWQSPNSLISGDAQGGSEYAKNVMKIYNKLMVANPKKKMGGQIMNEELEQGLKKFNNGGSDVLDINKKVYKAYFNKEVKGEKAKKIYDKLNRVYYKDAKAKNMSPSNYILTHVIT